MRPQVNLPAANLADTNNSGGRLTYAAAGLVQPTAFAAAPVAVGYANALLYADGGSQQIDVRHNYDGRLSSYNTTPFAYTSPVSSCYVAGASAAYAAPAVYTAPTAYASPAKYFAPTAYAAPTAFAAPARYVSNASLTAYAAGFGAALATAFSTATAKVVV